MYRILKFIDFNDALPSLLLHAYSLYCMCCRGLLKTIYITLMYFFLTLTNCRCDLVSGLEYGLDANFCQHGHGLHELQYSLPE